MVAAVLVAAVAVAVLVAGIAAEEAAAPRAAVSTGAVTGRWVRARSGRSFAAFEGIPYAEPPVGPLRFQAPRPPKPWSGTLLATKPGAVCSQKNPFLGGGFFGDEDCLFVNVYTPKGALLDGSIDVLVYIHGGAYKFLSGDFYRPEYFLDREVVFVSLNYRLDILGFFSTGDSVLPGNYGLKDQVAALHWIRENIAAFGGDPARVTIAGHSAGASSAHLLMLSPLAKGLFQRAVSLSGTSISSWAVTPPAVVRRVADRSAQLLGCPAAPSEALKECLLTKSSEELTSLSSAFLQWTEHPLMVYKPVLEPKSLVGAFIHRHPEEILTSGGPVSDVPFMTGFTSQDGGVVGVGIHINKSALQELEERWEYLLPMASFIDHFPKSLLKRTVNEIRKFYFGDDPISNQSASKFLNLFTDAYFAWPAVRAAELHATHGTSPVYLYEYAHQGQYSYSKLLGAQGSDYGVNHADELVLLFPHESLFPGSSNLSEEDLRISNELIDLLVTFAKTGKPTADDSWKPVAHPEASECFPIGSPNAFTLERMRLWRTLPVQITGAPPVKHDEL